MSKTRQRKTEIFLAIAMMFGWGAAQADSLWPTYLSGSEVLPEEAGWTFYDVNEPTDPSVIEGLLHQGLTTAAGTQGWTDDSHIFCFGSPDRFSISIKLKVVESDYREINNQWDSGFKVWAYDNAGRFACMGIASDGVRLTVSSDFSTSSSVSTQFYPFDTTDGFHWYSLNVTHLDTWNEDRVGFSIDSHAYVVNTLYHLGAENQGDFNIVGFGDASMACGSQVQVEQFYCRVSNSNGLLADDWLTDLDDLQIFADQWLRTDCGCDDFCEQADINQDGRVDLIDLSVLCIWWLNPRAS